MRLANITWPKAEQYFKESDMVLLTVGSIESHGRHMPLGTDTLIPDRILELIEEKNDILIAPTIPYGACQSLSSFPGTVDIDIDVLYALLTNIVQNLYNHGARKFLLLNGHGGNIKTMERIALDFEDKGCLTAVLNWWLMAWDLNPAWKGGHGGGEETAGVMGVDPSLVDMSEIEGPLVLKDFSDEIKGTGFYTADFKGVSITIPRKTQNVTDNGWIGPDHPNTATIEWGQEMLQATADYIADFIEAFKNVPLPQAK